VLEATRQLGLHIETLRKSDAAPIEQEGVRTPDASAAVASSVSAGQAVETALADIAARNGAFNAFTRVLSDRAIETANRLDAGPRRGSLFGIPFAVKDLFDVAGLPTTAGSKSREYAPPAEGDAPLVRRLEAAGAVLIGTLNMDEFAYGFVTRNAHFGDTRNPIAPDRIAGGSSGGTAAAVAAGFVAVALGSDTNGSIRVPAAFCGLWGLRPGDGRITHAGMYPFSTSLDQPGVMTRTAAELAATFDCVRDEVRTAPPPSARPRIGVLTGWFRRNADAGMIERLDAFCAAYGDVVEVNLPEAEQARSAAYVITAAEAGALHEAALETAWDDYDPATRDRLLAGTLLAAKPYIEALAVRRRYRARFDRLFDTVDYLVCPTTPVCAPLFDQQTIVIDGKELPARAHLGVLTQPLSLAGVPIVSAPMRHPSGLPMGIQIVGPRGGEEALLAFAVQLERDGLVGLR